MGIRDELTVMLDADNDAELVEDVVGLTLTPKDGLARVELRVDTTRIAVDVLLEVA